VRERERFVGDGVDYDTKPDAADRGRGEESDPPGHPGLPHLASANGQARETEPFRRIVDHSPDAICIHQDGRFAYANAVCVRWLAAGSVNELLGHELARFVHASSIPPIIARTATLRRPGDVSEATEAELMRLDGTYMHVEALSVLTTWKGRAAYQLVFRDLTEHQAARDTMRYQAALVDHVSDAIISVAEAGIVTTWNAAAESIYRRPAHRALALPISSAVGAPLDPSAIIAAGGQVHATHHAMDGTARVMRVSVSEIDNGYVVVCSDDTALRRAERHLNAVVDSLQEGVLVVHRNGWVPTINPAARRILGLGPTISDAEDTAALQELSLYDVDGSPITGDDSPPLKAWNSGIPTIGRMIGIGRADGETIWLSVTCRLLNPQDREGSPVLVTFTDVTAHRADNERLAHRAAHDVLTGLPNRAHIVEAIDALHDGEATLTAVLFIDLDDLKTVNDTLGHEIGDAVIRATADRLRQALRRDDIVGRLAGDEFVALLVGDDLDSRALEPFVQRIRNVLTEPITIPGGALEISASIGVIRTVPDDPRDAAALLREADAAMYAAKAKGRQASRFSRRAGDNVESEPRSADDIPMF
jgi:diguanylate cyclase (GGDEF)-like protein/PAS domain S-box-containing protein